MEVQDQLISETHLKSLQGEGSLGFLQNTKEGILPK